MKRINLHIITLCLAIGAMAQNPNDSLWHLLPYSKKGNAGIGYQEANTTFGQEINDLYSRVNELNTLVLQLQQSLAAETTRANNSEEQIKSLLL